MALTRTTTPQALTINLQLPADLSQGLPVSLQSQDLVTAGGQVVNVGGRGDVLVPSDVTDELLALLNDRLAWLGLELTRIEPRPVAEATE